MSQAQPIELDPLYAKLDKATTELENAAKKFEQATELKQALNHAGVWNEAPPATSQDSLIAKAKTDLKKAAEEVAKAQKNILASLETTPSAVATTSGTTESADGQVQKQTEIYDRAIAALNKVPSTPPKFDSKKMGLVIGPMAGILIAAILLMLIVPIEKPIVIVGLVLAVVGQLVQSAQKADDVKRDPWWTDVLSLLGESAKFVGALIAVIGAVIKI